ncbi:hypothetical protein ACFP81_04030 [Deinococcus lacus]|uniref:EamA domain-containing protein n=1 Tax=Deinococcus lacus TaxID=392561 RepID=A0ABW1YDG0_9DEIO
MNPALLTTALAPLVWGTTYLLTTHFVPGLPAPVLGLLRILPAGLLLLALARSLPPRGWWGRVAALALLRQGLFFTLLYASALHLPGAWPPPSGPAVPCWWCCWPGRCWAKSLRPGYWAWRPWGLWAWA